MKAYSMDLRERVIDACDSGIETLWSSLGKIMNKIDTGECINFIKHCGYRIRSLAATTTKALP